MTITVTGPCPDCRQPAELTIWVDNVTASVDRSASAGGLVTRVVHKGASCSR